MLLVLRCAVRFRKWSGQIVKDYKMHWVVHRHTAAELIVERADAEKEHMGLATWKATLEGKIVKSDVSIAKNYLNDKEMSYMKRIASLYLDYAELQAERQIPMSMED
mgnify:CR=1 FL=1